MPNRRAPETKSRAREINRFAAERRRVDILCVLVLAGWIVFGLYACWYILVEKNSSANQSVGPEALKAKVVELSTIHLVPSPEPQPDLVGAPEVAVVPPPQRGFSRDPNVPRLVDDLKNVGGLMTGHFARLHGCAEVYETRGRNFAVCSTKAQGIAALIDLIKSHDGRLIRHYIGGGDGRDDPWWNYTGGDAESIAMYFDVLANEGINIDSPIDSTVDQLAKLVRAHARAEGSLHQVTDSELSEAFYLAGIQ